MPEWCAARRWRLPLCRVPSRARGETLSFSLRPRPGSARHEGVTLRYRRGGAPPFASRFRRARTHLDLTICRHVVRSTFVSLHLQVDRSSIPRTLLSHKFRCAMPEFEIEIVYRSDGLVEDDPRFRTLVQAPDEGTALDQARKRIAAEHPETQGLSPWAWHIEKINR